MMINFKMTGQLYQEMLKDLRRPHPFATERVGFALGRLGTLAAGSAAVLLSKYHAIPDDEYIDDSTVGARIGPEALIWAMQAAYQGRNQREGVFHTHLHDFSGPTSMSKTDRAEIPPLLPGFRSVGRMAPHGIVILSSDHGAGWVWLPGSNNRVRSSSIAVIGVPVGVFDFDSSEPEEKL
jgi:hypothetical protein